jgi:hypothetical protein
MPYIKQESRHFDNEIRDVVEAIFDEEDDLDRRKGVVNYVITRIVLQSMHPCKESWSYNTISNAVSVLRDAATEMERRLMAKREDHAILYNGDLPEYANET